MHIAPSTPALPAPAQAGPAPAALPAARDAAPVAPPEPSPRLRLDPALGLVVLEFLDESGAVADSIPNQRQLDAYHAQGMG